MKTRMIYPRIWQDEYFHPLPDLEKLMFLYFLTNDKVNLCGIYHLPDNYILFETKLSPDNLQKIKDKFMKDNKFIFFDGWIKITNYEKYNQYTGEKNEIAKQKELELVPKELLKKGSKNSKPHDSGLSNIKYLSSGECHRELEKQFPKLDIKGIQNKCEELMDYCQAKGKRYKNYLAFARNAIRKDQDKLPKKHIDSSIPNSQKKPITKKGRQELDKVRKMLSAKLGMANGQK